MPAEPLDLDVIQKWFQAVVTHPDGLAAGVESGDAQQLIRLDRQELESIVTRSTNVSAHDRLAIYANAYYARLLECLGETFSVLKRAVGDEVFNEFAFGYLQKYPSRSYTLNRLGDRFADHLDATRPEDAGWADLFVDLARLEWTIGEVFDGPGVEKADLVTPEQWSAIPSDRFHEARIKPVACLRLLHARYPIHRYYTALRNAEDSADVAVPERGDQWMAITRRDYIVRRHALSRPQYELLNALQEGASVGVAIERAGACTDMSDEEFAQSLRNWFATWTADQLFESIDTSTPPLSRL